MLYKEYDNETLKKLQSIELEALRDFDALCTKYGLTYFMCGGSLIGTVRHQGFIPWDDDIDVALPRRDYENFLRIARKERYAKKYFVLNAETNPGYPLMTTRWCRRGTTFKEESMKNVKGDFGIFLDIYAFDNVPDNDFFMKAQAWHAWALGKLQILFAVDEPVLYYGGAKAMVVKAGSKAVHGLLHVLPISQQWVYRQTKRVTTEYYRKKTKRLNYLHDPKPFISTMTKDELLPVKRMPYENLSVCVPNDWDAYLSRRFGDYMKLPPEDQRHNHPPYELDFGDL